MEFEESPKKEGDRPIFTVKNSLLAYGGMAVKVVTAPLTQAYLVGKEWNKEVLQQAYEKLAEDLPLAAGAPGGMIEYRRSLTTSFFFKFYLQTLDYLYAGAVYVLILWCIFLSHFYTILFIMLILFCRSKDISFGIPENQKSAISKHHREVSTSQQAYQTKNEMDPVGAPVAHLSASKQV